MAAPISCQSFVYAIVESGEINETRQIQRQWGCGDVLAQLDICVEYNNWSSKDKAVHLKCGLTGIACQLIWHSGQPDYGELSEKVRPRFGSQNLQEKF